MTTADHKLPLAVGQAMVWKPDVLLKALLIWTCLLTGIQAWLPLVRASIEGQAYQWAFADGIGGRGTGGDYWLLVIGALFSAGVLYLGWRGARPPFHGLLLALHGGFAALVFYAAVKAPEQLFFEGATIGVRFSFATVGPIFFGSVFACALFWVIRDVRSRPRRSAPPWVWTRSRRIRLGLVVGCVPLQIILLRSWGPLGPGAVVGASLTVWQWFVMTYRLLEPVTAPLHDSMAV